MPYLLDTNHWIRLLKGRSPALARRLDRVSPSEAWLCSVVKEELFYGAYRYDNRAAREATLRKLFQRHPSAAFDDAAAERAALFRSTLEREGLVIGPHDLQIAAIAATRGWTLVTANRGEFSRLPELIIEDWTLG